MKTYIRVPFGAGHRAKALGARFDMAAKSWYVPDGVDLALFTEWLPGNLQRWLSKKLPKSAAAEPEKVAS